VSLTGASTIAETSKTFTSTKPCTPVFEGVFASAVMRPPMLRP
jgi:hypothetical protein